MKDSIKQSNEAVTPVYFKFSESLRKLPIESLVTKSLSTTKQQTKELANKPKLTLTDLPHLLSPNMQDHIETLAQRSHALTKQRFGNTMTLFIPMYLSNLCFNNCTYCGFSITHKYKRTTLTDSEIINEGLLLKEKGFQHLLLLTGEAPGAVDVPYIANAISLLKPHFASIGIEVQPFSTPEYQTLIQAGADRLTLYQETYHEESYKKYHLSGKKKNYTHRLDALDEGGRAGFFNINLGALLGLYDWRYEAIAMAHHLHHMQRHYWRSHYSISFPRIQNVLGGFKPEFQVSDTDLVQLICVFRLLFPDIGITLSTRENPKLRDNILPLGITTLSAESDTSPGGYSGKNAEGQFETADHRSLNEIKDLLKNRGYEPVTKDMF